MTLEPVTMTCEEVEDLAGAYAIGALPQAELDAVEEHLASCRQSDHSQLRDLSETAGWLPFAVPASEPPPDLGARIVAAARPALETAADVRMAPARAAVLPFRRAPTPALRFALAAAATTLLAIGLGAWGVAQHNVLVSARAAQARQSAVLALLDSGGTVVQTPATASIPAALLVEPRGGGPAYLLQSWPSLTGGRTYQAWYISQGTPVSAGVFGGSSGGLEAVQLAGSIRAAQAFAVTVEPSGGSAQPTSEPLFVRPLTAS